jgi:ParB family transcriptional regulator, chromosome partitioning protein
VRASRLAGRTTAPAFLDERVDPYAQAIENLQREDLSPFDLAQFIADREREGDSRASIARKLHKPRSFITEVAGLIDAPADVRTAYDTGRARDTRVLYQLARKLRENRAAVKPLLVEAGPINRDTLESRVGAPARDPTCDSAAAGLKVQGTKRADALLVEYGGRRGRLGWAGWPGKRTGEVRFDDGSRKVLELAELKLIAWTAR